MCDGPQMDSKSSALLQSRPGPCCTSYIIYYANKVLRAAPHSPVSHSASSQACDLRTSPPEECLLTARWRASACWTACLFSSSALCLSSTLSSASPRPPLSFSGRAPSPICIPVSLLLIPACSSSGPVLRVLWRGGPVPVHPMSPARASRSWLPALPEARHVQGLQHAVLPRRSPGSAAEPRLGPGCWNHAER